MDKRYAFHASILHDAEGDARHARTGRDRKRRSAVFQALPGNSDCQWFTELPDDIGHPGNFDGNAVLRGRLVKPSRGAAHCGIVKVLVAATRFDRDGSDLSLNGDSKGKGGG